MKNLIARFVREDAGQDLIEYALLLGIISLTLVTVLPAIGAKVLAIFQAFETQLPGAPAGS
jgi:Flp pilus assembly pilin Flp